MLKTAPHFVLASSKSSTYLRGYASGVDLAAASCDGRFEHRPIDAMIAMARQSRAEAKGEDS